MRILFMCVANSARSQLAEGLAYQIFSHADIKSAGSHPAKLNPFAVQVMKDIGIDISKHYSKSVDDLPSDFLADLDYVITLCAEEVCPILISKAKKLHWPFSDPASKQILSEEISLKRFRETRDSINRRIQEFQLELN